MNVVGELTLSWASLPGIAYPNDSGWQKSLGIAFRIS